VTHVVDVNGINLGVATYSQSTTTAWRIPHERGVQLRRSDGYTYDPNTGRMKSYTFSVNGDRQGYAHWNPNGTLGIWDSRQSVRSLTPNLHYVYDDLARVAGHTCRSAKRGTRR